MKRRPTGCGRSAPSPESLAVRVQAQATSGPGIHPEPSSGARRGGRRLPRVAAAQRQAAEAAGYAAATVTLPLGDITAEQLRVLDGPGRRLRRRHAAPDDRSGHHRAVDSRRRARGVLHAAGRGRTRPGRSGPADQRHKLSGGRVVSARGDAVARTRPYPARRARREQGAGGIRAGPRGEDERMPQRVRAASHRRHRVPGQHSQARLDAPFRSTSCSSAADRRPRASRSAGWRRRFRPGVRRSRSSGSSGSISGRSQRAKARRPSSSVSASRIVKSVIADLEPLTEETAEPEDFIDLGETDTYSPEVMDGECAS